MSRAKTLGLACAIALVVAGSADAQRRPYLQRLAPTEVTIVWRADPGPGEVCYGSSPDALTESVRDEAVRADHALRLTGLSPDTRYFYAAGASCPATAAAGDYFVTPPVAGTPQPFRMWVVGDSGTGSTNQRRVRDAMLAYTAGAPPDVFLHVGDMAYSDGTDSEFTERFYGIYADIMAHTVCWPALGNHEAHTANSMDQSGPYYEGYVLPAAGEAGGVISGTEAYYSFDRSNVHFVVLDSADSDLTAPSPMLDWLEEDLAATDQEWIVAYYHHPPYTKGSHDSDREGRHIDMREHATPLLERYGVDLVLGGHSHSYERSYLVEGAYDTPTTADGHIVDPGDGRVDGDGAYDMRGPGAVYVVAGHGGTGVSGPLGHPLMAHDETVNGSVVIDVEGSSMTLHNIQLDGTESDWATLVKGEGIVVVAPRAGGEVLAGSDLDILWSATGDTTEVAIDLSLDDGETWLPVVARTEDTGRFAWTAPLAVTRVARMRVSDADEPAVFGVSGRFAITDRTEDTLIPFGGVWEYEDREAPPADWTTTTGGWPSGPAQLGYGDGDEATVLHDADPNIPTVYFRQAIELPGEVTAARLEVLYDDAIAVFVNGAQVFARNIGSLAHDEYASGSSDDDMREGADLDPAVFRPGTNVIAALVKQSSGGSSDVSFDLSLHATLRVEIPDAGPGGSDAGRTDGGAGVDAAGIDGGGARPDGAPEPMGSGGGCGCRTSGRGHALFMGLALVLWARRRRG